MTLKADAVWEKGRLTLTLEKGAATHSMSLTFMDLMHLLEVCERAKYHTEPKKFAEQPIDTKLYSHTSNPEYECIRENAYMDALRDRTIKIDVPALAAWQAEIDDAVQPDAIVEKKNA